MKKLLLFVVVLLLQQMAFANVSRQDGFVKQLLPAIRQANAEVKIERQRLNRLYGRWRQDKKLKYTDKRWLMNTAKHYKLPVKGIVNQQWWQQILTRVDTLPASLVLAQAANESAWGQSRFAKNANNYFGQWCFTPGCGVVPRQRRAGAHYEVRRFSSRLAAVRSYIYNINTNHAYANLRAIRAAYRQQHKDLNGIALAQGLVNYSQRGQAYVQSIRSIIRAHQLETFDSQIA